MKAKQMKAMKHVINLSRDLKNVSVRQAQEALKAHIQVKSELGASEAVRPEVGGSSQNPYNFAHSSPFNPIHVDSHEHTTLTTDDLPLS